MCSRDRSKRRGAGLIRLCVILLVSAAWIGVAQADAQLEGQGDLGQRNLTNGTLEIGGDVYYFTSASIILDRDGKEVALDTLDVQDEGSQPRLHRVQSGRFSAVEVGDRHVIQRLELVEPPR